MGDSKIRLWMVCTWITVLCFPLTVQAERIAIIGTGSVAGALGPEFAMQGHTIVYGSRQPDRDDVAALVARTGRGASATDQRGAAEGADIVVLAIPGERVREITRGLGDLAGKIVIDPTNPLGQDDSGQFILIQDTSNTEIIQQVAPGARVVKAFSTLNVAQMVNPGSSGGPISVILAGDDQDAKKVVAELARGMGLEPIDVGPARAARSVESMILLFLNNWASGRQRFDYYLRPVPKH